MGAGPAAGARLRRTRRTVELARALSGAEATQRENAAQRWNFRRFDVDIVDEMGPGMSMHEQLIRAVAAVLGVSAGVLDVAWEAGKVGGVAINGQPVDVLAWAKLTARGLPVLPWEQAYPERADEAPELPTVVRRPAHEGHLHFGARR